MTENGQKETVFSETIGMINLAQCPRAGECVCSSSLYFLACLSTRPYKVQTKAQDQDLREKNDAGSKSKSRFLDDLISHEPTKHKARMFMQKKETPLEAMPLTEKSHQTSAFPPHHTEASHSLC